MTTDNHINNNNNHHQQRSSSYHHHQPPPPSGNPPSGYQLSPPSGIPPTGYQLSPPGPPDLGLPTFPGGGGGYPGPEYATRPAGYASNSRYDRQNSFNNNGSGSGVPLQLDRQMSVPSSQGRIGW